MNKFLAIMVFGLLLQGRAATKTLTLDLLALDGQHKVLQEGGNYFTQESPRSNQGRL